MTPRSPLPAETMLTVLAYFQDRGPVAIAEAARDLSLTESSLRKALGQLWTCGLPGYGPGELIDLAFSSEVTFGGPLTIDGDFDEPDAFDDDPDLLESAEYVEVTFSAGITRPLRLTFEEAVTLKTALATLIGRPEVVDQDGLQEALAILSSISTPAARLDAAEAAQVVVNKYGDAARDLRAALETGHAVRFLYHSAKSDSSRIRIVDGGRVHLDGEHTYLRGFDRGVGEWRTFRVDRIADVEDLGPAKDIGPEPEDGDQAPTAHIYAEIPAGAEWFLDEYPFGAVEHRADGSVRVRVDYYDAAWLRRFLCGNATTLVPCDPELRAEIAETAARALAAYDQD